MVEGSPGREAEAILLNKLFKIAIIGESGVGKTYILNRYAKGELPEQENATIGVELMVSNIVLPRGSQMRVNFFDTAGEEKFHAVTSAHYRKAVGVIITYDITSVPSFIRARNWLDDVKEMADQHCVILLLGNKLDKERERVISRDEGETFARANNLMFYEVSALENIGVKEAIDHMASRILELHLKMAKIEAIKYQGQENLRIQK
jgi:small GTP-binding protein